MKKIVISMLLMATLSLTARYSMEDEMNLKFGIPENENISELCRRHRDLADRLSQTPGDMEAQREFREVNEKLRGHSCMLTTTGRSEQPLLGREGSEEESEFQNLKPRKGKLVVPAYRRQ